MNRRKNHLDTKAAMALGAFTVIVSAAASPGCAERNITVGVDDGRPPLLASSADAGEGDASIPETVPMCPVTTCTLPWATCPSSEFPCGTNLLNDDENCGGCGISCGGDGVVSIAKWSCVDGKCTFSCGGFSIRNCDNDPTNGCEVDTLFNPDNCGDCGNKCPAGMDCSWGACVDPCLEANLPDRCNGECVNLDYDDNNCGTCGNTCDPTDPKLPALPADMHYGCGGGTCGRKRCSVPNTADCNGNLNDGCEATLHTNEHCGACGDACPPGKECGYITGNVFGCLCDDGETYCHFSCKQTADDPLNCGGCDRVCPYARVPHFAATCSFGTCGGHCEEGYVDCDESLANGCEVNTRVDNRNCGGCGNACLPNQVCFQGQCQVAPCDAGVSGGPTK